MAGTTDGNQQGTVQAGGTVTTGTGNMTPTGGGQSSGAELKFSQADVDAIIRDRLTREQGKYADYSTLKQKAEQFDAQTEAQKTEAQKLQDAKARAEAERDAALKRANDMLIRSAFIAAAAQAGVAHPDDVYALADLSGVTIDDKGNVLGADVAAKAVIDAGRVPISGQRGTPTTNAGAGGGQRSAATITLTPEESAVARKMGLTDEQYAASKTVIQKNRQGG